MVEVVGHALVDGTVDLDIDVVANLEGPHVRREVLRSIAAKGAREFGAGAAERISSVDQERSKNEEYRARKP